MRFLLSPALCSEYCDYADKLLKCYVTTFVRIYGSEHLLYNTHSLINLADDARKFGALDRVSCFPFEIYLGTLKRLVRRTQNPLQQVVRCLGEKPIPFDNGKEMRNKLQQPHLYDPTLPEFPARVQYKKYRHEGNIISCSKATTALMLRAELLL